MSINKYWVGAAAAVKDVWILDVSFGAWKPGDTFLFSIGSRTLTLAVGANSEDNTVAAGIVEAWNSSDRLDGIANASGCSSTAGGQSYGEFAELVASADGPLVTFVARVAGKPTRLGVQAMTDTSGEIAFDNTLEATGPNFYSDPFNWFPYGVPDDTDTLIFRNSTVDCLYNLPQGNAPGATDNAYELHDITLDASYTGRFGLPPTNNDNPNGPYPEFRVRAPIFGSGLGTSGLVASNWHIGVGAGAGSRLVNLAAVGSAVTVNVHRTATAFQGDYAVHLAIDGLAINVLDSNASVAIEPDFSVDSKIDALNVSGGNVLYSGNQSRGGTCVITTTGGNILVYGPQSSLDTWKMRGGVATFQDFSCSSFLGEYVSISSAGPATIVWNSSSDIFDLQLTNGATLDAEQDIRPFNVYTANMYAGSTYADGHGRSTIGSGLKLNKCGPQEVTIRLGSGVTLGVTY